MLAVPFNTLGTTWCNTWCNTLVTRSRSREKRARGGDSGQEFGLGLGATGFAQLGQEGPAPPDVTSKQLLSNLKGSSRSRSRGGVG
mgnify:CR=1 FL=1